MNQIQLTLINRSDDSNSNQIVLFQKNESATENSSAVAWTVIQNSRPGDHYSFTYSHDVFVAITDSSGNDSPMYLAAPGTAFKVIENEIGDELQQSKNASPHPEAIELSNDLPVGSITAKCYRDNRLCDIINELSPGQKAIFRFKPAIWPGVVKDANQGNVMDSAIISSINTQLDLYGIARADIIMTGGGPGPNSTPFEFTLENIVYA